MAIRIQIKFKILKKAIYCRKKSFDLGVASKKNPHILKVTSKPSDSKKCQLPNIGPHVGPNSLVLVECFSFPSNILPINLVRTLCSVSNTAILQIIVIK